jgi:WXG100 family type VII secretion target
MFELNPYWDGAAKQSFENKFMMFIENFEKLVNSFESLNDKLKETMKTYDTADNDVTSAIGKLGG